MTSLFTKKEQEQVKERIKNQIGSINVLFQDWINAEEEVRILLKHFNLSKTEFAEIKQKYVDVPDKLIAKILAN